MPRIRAFDGYLVNPACAAQVVSPAYDAVSPTQRRKFAEANPQNYLNAMRLQDDFPADARPSVEKLLALNKACLDELLSNGSFNLFAQPCLFLYRLSVGGHVQTGVVCEVSVDEYRQGRLRKHEDTRSDKEDLLAMYQQVVGVSSSPICLAHPHDDAIAAWLARTTEQPPELDFVSADGVAQQVWRISDAAQQRELQELFDAIEITYLTDGHHRAASALRYANQHGDADGAHNQLLVALFSAAQLSLLPFHRVVRDINGMSEAELVEALQKDFAVEARFDCATFAPSRHGEFGMLVNGHWYCLRVRDALRDALTAADDPVDSLDVSILQNRILAPILGITDTRSDPRLDYVSGDDGDGLRQKCAEGWAIGFACFATSMAQLMAVADAGALMPPKSTYFNPKTNSGVFVRRK